MMAPRITEKFLFTRQRHGLPNALYYLTLKAANAVVPFKILRGVLIERADPAFLDCPHGYTWRFLTEEAIRELAKNPENGMSESFVEEALRQRHECLAIFDGARLAAYGWYSRTPTRIDPPDLILHFGKDYVYMYKGYTHTAYRGQRLHAIGMTLALRHYVSNGLKGLISYVESNNFDSLKSCARMGYIEFGSIYIVKIFGRYLIYPSRECRKLGFTVRSA